jgi:two-component system cell cycle response regulator DivK
MGTGDGAMTKILLVEDNEMNRDMLGRRLQRRGFDLLVAVDGAQGLAMAQADAPDLILMDMSLPVMDGWEATRRLKAAPETRSIPVIALTAHAVSGDREKAIEAGCDDYDTKPVDLDRLLSKIGALLSGKAAP